MCRQQARARTLPLLHQKSPAPQQQAVLIALASTSFNSSSMPAYGCDCADRAQYCANPTATSLQLTSVLQVTHPCIANLPDVCALAGPYPVWQIYVIADDSGIHLHCVAVNTPSMMSIASSEHCRQ